MVLSMHSRSWDHPSHPGKWIDIRPRFGKGRVLARLGWAGERRAFLSILTESGR